MTGCCNLHYMAPSIAAALNAGTGRAARFAGMPPIHQSTLSIEHLVVSGTGSIVRQLPALLQELVS